MAVTIAQIRRDYPQYKGMSDRQLADALHGKFYPSMPIDTFYTKVGIKSPESKSDSDSLLSTVGRGLESGSGSTLGALGSLGKRYLGTGLGLDSAGEWLTEDAGKNRSAADRAVAAAQADRERAAATSDPGVFAGTVGALGRAVNDGFNALPPGMLNSIPLVGPLLTPVASLLPESAEEAAVQGAKITAPFQSGRAALNFAAEQAPATIASMIPGAAAGRIGLAAGLAEASAARLATRTALGTGATLNAASAARQASDAVLQAGGTQDQADRAYDKALVIAAGVSAAAARMPSLERQIFSGERAAGPLAARVAKGAAKAAIAEAPQEFVEEAGGQFAQNVGQQGTPAETPLSQDVFSAGALGAIGGIGVGAPIGGVNAALPGGAQIPLAEPAPAPTEPTRAPITAVDVAAEPAAFFAPDEIAARLTTVTGEEPDSHAAALSNALKLKLTDDLAEDNPVASLRYINDRKGSIAKSRLPAETKLQRLAILDEAKSIVTDYQARIGESRAQPGAVVTAPVVPPTDTIDDMRARNEQEAAQEQARQDAADAQTEREQAFKDAEAVRAAAEERDKAAIEAKRQAETDAAAAAEAERVNAARERGELYENIYSQMPVFEADQEKWASRPRKRTPPTAPLVEPPMPEVEGQTFDNIEDASTYMATQPGASPEYRAYIYGKYGNNRAVGKYIYDMGRYLRGKRADRPDAPASRPEPVAEPEVAVAPTAPEVVPETLVEPATVDEPAATAEPVSFDPEARRQRRRAAVEARQAARAQVVGDGTSVAPVIASTPEHVDVAAAQVAEPTEAQKESGNYRKGHVNIQGLDIAIENPKGSERSGTDANGEAWSVTMPDHYGYVKRTEGADGDAVDVYIGPDPQAPTVFVVDQQDHETGKFDEHKAMIGYADEAAARDAYHAAFSDGKGPDRVGAVVPMAMDDFKAWLKGDTTAPAVEAPVATPTPTAPVDTRAEAVTRRAMRERTLGWLKPMLDKITPTFRARYTGARTGMDAPLQNAFGVAELPSERSSAKAFELLDSAIAGQLKMLERNYFDPLIAKLRDVAKSHAVDPQDVGMYLLARHAAERNRVVAARNPNLPTGGSGLTNVEARAVLAELNAQGKTQALEDVAKLHDRLRDFNLNEMVRGGLLSSKDAAKLRAEMPNYTPLKGWAVDGDMQGIDDEAHSGSSGWTAARKGVPAKAFVAAKGRTSMTFNPLFNLISDAQRTVERANRNLAAQPFIENVLSEPEAYEDVVSVYTDKKPDMYATGEFNPRTGSEMMKPVNMKADPRYITIKRNGENYYVKPKDSEAGRAVREAWDDMSPAQLGWGWRAATWYTGIMKSLRTRFSPGYLLGTAPFRDIQDALVTAAAEEKMPGGPAFGKKIAARTAYYMLPGNGTYQAIGDHLRGGEPSSPEGAEAMLYLEQMIEDGGSIGHALIRDAERSATDAIKTLERMKAVQDKKPGAMTLDGIRALGQALDDFSQMIDLQPRLATYRAALDAGIERPDAARLALNSSLNLTRRMRDGRKLEVFWPFINAGVASVAKNLRLLKSPAYRNIMYSLAGMGSAVTAMNLMLGGGGDDDGDGQRNYQDIPESDKAGNLIVYYGMGGDDYLKVPMGFMVGFPVYLGQKMTETATGMNSAGSAGVEMMNGIVDIAKGFVNSYSPVRGTADEAGDIPNAAVPAPLRIPVDLWRNKDFWGKPIYNEPYDKDTAPSSVSRENTAGAYKWWAEAVNRMSGGKDGVAGWASYPAEGWRYLLMNLGGGPASFTKQVVGAADKATHEGVTARDMPVADRFLGNVAKYAPMQKYMEASSVMAPLATAEKNADPAEWASQVASYPIESDPALLDAFRASRSELQQLGKEKKQALIDAPDHRAVIEDFNKRRNAIYVEFNRAYNEARD